MCFVQKRTILGLTHLFTILFSISFAKIWQFSGKLFFLLKNSVTKLFDNFEFFRNSIS